jgi:hypothetical protein
MLSPVGWKNRLLLSRNKFQQAVQLLFSDSFFHSLPPGGGFVAGLYRLLIPQNRLRICTATPAVSCVASL